VRKESGDMQKGRIGVIGGSGLYEIEGFKEIDRLRIETPFGSPSDELVLCSFAGRDCIFLPRHGGSHNISPSNINYRANIYAMKKAGVSRIISVSAVGSLKEDLRPLDFVLPDQFIDRTGGIRKDTFFDSDMVVHIGFSDPVCTELKDTVFKAVSDNGDRIHGGGIYVNMEGPAFSTKAESNLYRSWGADIIGMTNLTEAKLAREAQICYCTLASITDYDCWHEKAGPVSVEEVIGNLKKSADQTKKILKNLIPGIQNRPGCPCRSALKDAVITPADAVSKDTKESLKLLFE
jgi:5'-methylthioadenosine phosphorylase